MFYVDKTTLSRYWRAYAGRVAESIEPRFNSEREFDSLESAKQYAAKLAYEKLSEDYHRLDKVSIARLINFKVRSLWNQKARETLKKYRARMRELERAMLQPIPVKVELLPDQIMVEGERLEIGSKFYEVNTTTGKLQTYTITKEHINYYSGDLEGDVLYSTDHGRTISELKSPYSNVLVFRDIDEAKEEAKKALLRVIDRAMEDIKKLN
jgi:hypothetical protein